MKANPRGNVIETCRARQFGNQSSIKFCHKEKCSIKTIQNHWSHHKWLVLVEQLKLNQNHAHYLMVELEHATTRTLTWLHFFFPCFNGLILWGVSGHCKHTIMGKQKMTRRKACLSLLLREPPESCQTPLGFLIYNRIDLEVKINNLRIIAIRHTFALIHLEVSFQQYQYLLSFSKIFYFFQKSTFYQFVLKKNN